MFLAISGDLCSGKKLFAEYLKAKHGYNVYNLKDLLRIKLKDPNADYYSPKYTEARQEVFKNVLDLLLSDICAKHAIFPIIDLPMIASLKMFYYY
jgi:hypothetical protein